MVEAGTLHRNIPGTLTKPRRRSSAVRVHPLSRTKAQETYPLYSRESAGSPIQASNGAVQTSCDAQREWDNGKGMENRGEHDMKALKDPFPCRRQWGRIPKRASVSPESEVVLDGVVTHRVTERVAEHVRKTL